MDKLPGQFKLFLDAQANQNSRQRLFETIWTHYYSRLAVFIRGMISSPDHSILRSCPERCCGDTLQDRLEETAT